MFFDDHEKRIYEPPGSDRKFDPIVLRHTLTILSGARLAELVSLRNAPAEDIGDVSAGGRQQARVDSAQAELELAKIARKAFELPDFPECTDGTALEYLYDFLDWLEKKGERGNPPPGS